MWRRRPDSNRRIGVLQTPPLDHLGTSPQYRAGCPSRIRTSVHGFKVRCPTTRRRGIDPGSPRDWSGRRDSNPRPSHWQCDALPTEPLPHRVRPLMVPRARFELATPRSSGACSTTGAISARRPPATATSNTNGRRIPSAARGRNGGFRGRPHGWGLRPIG